MCTPSTDSLDSRYWSWNYNWVGCGAKIFTSQKIDISFVTSLSCLVMDVRGNLGFMDGLRLMVPVVGKSHSNATSQHDEGAPPSLIQPLELELEALLRDESLRRNRGPAKKFQYYYKLCCMNNGNAGGTVTSLLCNQTNVRSEIRPQTYVLLLWWWTKFHTRTS